MSLLNLLIVGHGSQARAWSNNLQASGVEVAIGLRKESPSIEIVKKNGLKCLTIDDLKTELNYDGVIFLTPDDSHEKILCSLSKYLPQGARIVYAHGFSVVKDKLNEKYPQFSHLLLAPKAIASEVSDLYINKKPIPAGFSLEFSLNHSEDMAFMTSLAKLVGMTGRLIQTSFKEETNCDLFSEQSILCSVLPRVIKISFDTLVKNGVSSELAFLECCLEAKYILNALLKIGFSDFFQIISPNALIGANKAHNLLFSKEFEQKFDQLFHEIEEGQFYQEIESSDIDTLRRKMVSLYSEGDIEKTRALLKEYLN